VTRAGRPRRAPAVPEALPRLLAGWNAHDPASVATAFSPDGVRHQFSMPEFRFVGRYAIAVGVDAIITAIPDCLMTVRSQFVGADGRVTLEWTLTGTHARDLPGVPANDGPVTLPGASVFTPAPDGRILTEHAYWDVAGLMDPGRTGRASAP